MAKLTRETIQKLAVLRALSLWRRGAYGPLRLQKTLFYADKQNTPQRRFFTYKKWRLGQYSDEISRALNDLRKTGRLEIDFEGPAERLKAILSSADKRHLEALFRKHFPEWSQGLARSFQELAYLTNDAIIEIAHDDSSYKHAEYGEEIFHRGLSDLVDLPHLDAAAAERLTDLVDARLHDELAIRFQAALKRPAIAEDWRTTYFAEEAFAAS